MSFPVYDEDMLNEMAGRPSVRFLNKLHTREIHEMLKIIEDLKCDLETQKLRIEHLQSLLDAKVETPWPMPGDTIEPSCSRCAQLEKELAKEAQRARRRTQSKRIAKEQARV